MTPSPDAGRRPKLRMRYCFVCQATIGARADDDHDDLDTCGAPDCLREARQEAFDRAEDDADWHCD